MMLSRRALLQKAAAAGFLLAGGAGLRFASSARAAAGKTVPFAQYFYANPPQAWSEAEVRRGGQVTFVFSGDPPHFDPALTTSWYMLGAVGPVYDRLIRPKWGDYANPNTPEIVPDLAERWEVSPDELTYTFYLRRGVRWHDVPPVNGREFVADDVKFTFERYRGSVVDFLVAPIRSIETPDKYTVRLTLKERSPGFFPNLASTYAVITPREVVERDGDLKKTLIGTGPFILKEYVPKTHLTYVRNPHFRDPGQPYLDSYRIVIIPDESARVAAFRAGEIDYLWTNDVEIIKAVLASHPKTVVHRYHIPAASFHIAFRLDKDPYRDVRVRRAISMAINREEMNQLVYAGQGRAYALGIPWPVAFDDWPNKEAYGPYYQYNPQRARALLREAGYGRGFKAKLIYYAYGDDRVLQAEMIQNYLGDIGIQVEVARLDYGVWIDQYLKGKFEDMALGFTVPAGGMELGHDWTYELMRCQGVKNSWHICDPELDALLEAQREETDPAKRRAIFRQIWDKEVTNVYRAYIAQEVRFNMWHPWVRNTMGWGGYRWDLLTYGSSHIRTVWVDERLKG
ncbi:MAG: peptide ABC transporter substrate-binding protein [Candidatus Tectimicrobiota bacterium]|nr:MAG: peptide ABC transporter substrate-binding protein [Candidatus Tectomicrobia bacterium]